MKKTLFFLLFMLVGITCFCQVLQPEDTIMGHRYVIDSEMNVTWIDTIYVDYAAYQDVIGGVLTLKRNFDLLIEYKVANYVENDNRLLLISKDQQPQRVKIMDQWWKPWRLIFYKPRGGVVVFL